MVSKFAKKRFMEEVLNVFSVVKSSGRSGGFRGFLFVSWFSRIDAYRMVLKQSMAASYKPHL